MTKPPDNEKFPTLSKPGGKGHDREDSSPFDNPSEISKGDRIDDFEILERIGEGGMGVVYKAYETSLKRIVALKVLHPNIISDVSIAKRFRREAILAANLSHPHIVPVFHIENSETPRYFTMEFVQGRSLEEKVKSDGFLSPDQALRIALQACEALQYSHEHNIIHRDIKPSNIMLQNHVEHVRITDFGIAQDITGGLADITQVGLSTPGTPGFESPEQNMGQKLDERTDIFSLGMTLYYMLTGRLAYIAKNRQELAVAFREQTPPPPSQFNTSVNSTLDEIVLRMIAVNPKDRYSSAASVARDLNAIQSIHYKNSAHRWETWKKNRVYRMSVVGSLAFVLLITILVFTYLVYEKYKPDRSEEIPSNITADRMTEGLEEKVPDQEQERFKQDKIFADDFSDAVIDDSLWEWGQTNEFSYKNTGKQEFKVSEEDGSLLIESKAEHDRGWTSIQDVWLDSKVDLKGYKKDIAIDIQLSGVAHGGAGGYLDVLLSSGEGPTYPRDPASVRLFSAFGYKNKPLQFSGRQLSIVISWSSQTATVYVEGRPQFGLANIDVSSLDKWKLRFYVSTATSAGFTDCIAKMELHVVSVTSTEVKSGVIGRVINAVTNRGVPEATVRDIIGITDTISELDGTFELSSGPGTYAFEAEAKDYVQLERVEVQVEKGVRKIVDIKMRKINLGYGDVVESIIYEPNQILAITAHAGYIYYTAPSKSGRVLLHRMKLDGNDVTEIRELQIGRGLAFRGDVLYGVEAWPGRLLKVSASGPPLTVGRLNTQWPLDMTFDGKNFWHIENDTPDNKYGIYAIAPYSGRVVAHFTSNDQDINGLEWANDKLWVSSLRGMVYEVDPEKARAGGKLEAGILRKFTGKYSRLFFAEDYLWGLDVEANRICKIKITDQ